MLNGATDQITSLASLQISDVSSGVVEIAFTAGPTVSITVKATGLSAATIDATDFIL